MRILYVCSDFGVPVYGHKGASIHLRAMARAFADLGHELRILSPAIEREANLDFDLPVETPVSLAACAPALAELRTADRWLGELPTGHAARVSQEVRNLLYNAALARAADQLRVWTPDFVYERYALFGSGGLELARQLGVPHVLEVNAPLCLEQERARGLHLGDVARAVEARVWCETGALLAVSAELRAMALDLGTAPQRAHVLPNGVDAARFVAAPGAAASVRAELDLGAGPVVGFVGSLKSWHGTDVLLGAFAALRPQWPGARLLVVGAGPMAATLAERAQALGIGADVRFTGAVEHVRIPALLAAMDVAVAPYLPSEDFYFSPIKVYEYMAAGRPVVASRLGQIVDLVGAGLVCPAEPGDPASLAAALAGILRDEPAAAAQAARGRDWVLAERTWAANARRVVEIALAPSGAPTR
jgi:glycosyltransferase involved in cell wall biosynthesis